MRRQMPAGLISAGFQTGALNSTAVALTSTIRANKPSALFVSVETAGARLRADSTAPAASTGVLLTSTGSPYWFDAYDNSATFNLVGALSTAGVYSIQAFTRAGDST